MRQTRHNQSFLVGLTFGDLPEHVLAKRLASLTKLAMIAVLELLEYAHGALNSGGRDDFFDRIGHAETTPELNLCSNMRLAGAISPSYLQKRAEPLKLIFAAAASAASVE